MKLKISVGLFGSGRFVRSPLAQLPRLAERLGPVVASSHRVASRIVNTIRAGYAVPDLNGLEGCRLILLCVGEDLLEESVSHLAGAAFNWTGKNVLLCDSSEDSGRLAPLANAGASVASFNQVAGRAIVEGDKSAIRDFKRTLLRPAYPTLELTPGGKPSFLAGLTLASLPAYLAAGSDVCFRGAGSNIAAANGLVHDLISDSMRVYRKAGRKAIEGRWKPGTWDSIERQHRALRSSDPAVARYFAAVLRACVALTSERLPPKLAAQFGPAQPDEPGGDHEPQPDQPWNSAVEVMLQSQ